MGRIFAMKTTMRRVVGSAVFGGLALSLLFAAAALPSLSATWGFLSFLNSDYLSVDEVCQRWGERPLDILAFRSAEEDEPARAAMVCSLLRNQGDYLGMDLREIGQLFGDSRGYFINERHPSYLIEIAKTEKDNSWQIVFMTSLDGKVTEVVVHKNCC